jgi:hypothetical protein
VGGLIGPKTSIIYSTIFRDFDPFDFVFTIFFINNAIQNTEDISKLTQIPLIG